MLVHVGHCHWGSPLQFVGIFLLAKKMWNHQPEKLRFLKGVTVATRTRPGGPRAVRWLELFLHNSSHGVWCSSSLGWRFWRGLRWFFNVFHVSWSVVSLPFVAWCGLPALWPLVGLRDPSAQYMSFPGCPKLSWLRVTAINIKTRPSLPKQTMKRRSLDSSSDGQGTAFCCPFKRKKITRPELRINGQWVKGWNCGTPIFGSSPFWIHGAGNVNLLIGMILNYRNH